jgi:putative ABC transport system substrate-binding protein
MIIRAGLATALVLALGLLAAQAQPPAKMPRIGVLTFAPLTEDVRQAIGAGLQEHGYVEGQNILIEWRTAEGRSDRAAARAADLVRLKVDVIVAIPTPSVQAAKNATSTIPIVMAPAGDPVGTGLVTSLARPGGNITGITGTSAELAGKQLEMLRQVVPGLARLAVLIHSIDNDTFAKSLVEQTEAAAKTTGIRLQVVSVRELDELDRAFATMTKGRVEGVIVQGLFTASFGRIAQLCLRSRLPSVSSQSGFADAGGLLVYGARQSAMQRRAGYYVARILKGAKPSDLPVEQASTFDLVVNLKTARALGLTIPGSLLQRADQVIE